jgi:membrane protein DedA with SNARE-associated domain
VSGIQSWLGDLPPLLIYVVVGAIVFTESMGIPMPGEIVLVSAALLTAAGVGHPAGVAIGASAGAIIGDSIGYLVGHHGGRPLLRRLGRRFPKHLGPEQVARAEQVFARWGVWTVFFGRFVALLRILAGPLAGALRVPYRKFLLANASGGIIWATGTTLVVYWIGVAAQRWLERFSWVALLVVVLFGIATTLVLRRRAERLRAVPAADPPGDGDDVGTDAALYKLRE